MRFLLTGLLAIASLSAYAHVSDDELISNIDIGSKLTLIKDINIPAHNKILVKDGLFYRYFSHAEGGSPVCKLAASDKDKLPLKRDVLIRTGEILVAIANQERQILFKTSRGGLLHIWCTNAIKGGHGVNEATIGQMKQAFTGIATLELADPIEL